MTRVVGSVLCAGVLGAAPRISAAQEGREFGELTPQEQIQAVLAQGKQLFESGDFEAAINTYTGLIQQLDQRLPVTPPAPLVLRAQAYAALEEYQPAIEDLKQALQSAQNEPRLLPEIQNTRAEVFMKVGAYDQAFPDLQSAVQGARTVPKFQFNYGKVLVLLGGAELAEKAFDKYFSLTELIEANAAETPDSNYQRDEEQFAEAYLLRARARGGQRKFEEAFQDIDSVLELQPDNHEAFFTRGQIALQQMDYESAIADFQRALQNYTPEDEEDLFPYAEGYLFLASAIEEFGKFTAREGAADQAAEAYAACEEACEEFLDLLPPDDPRTLPSKLAALFRRGVAERLLGKLGEAVTSFSQVLEIDPNQGEAYFRRGICFHFLGESKLAVRDFEQAAAINFDSPRSNLWKGMSHAQSGDYRDAIRAYGESIAVSDRYTPAYVNRGLAHLALGNNQKAIDDFNEAIRLNPTDAENYYRRGKAQSAAGERELAIQSFSNAIEFDPTLRLAYEAIAAELEADGQEALAEEYRRRGLAPAG